MSPYWELGAKAYEAGIPVESADALSFASAGEWRAGWYAASAARTANAVVPTDYHAAWNYRQLSQVLGMQTLGAGL